MTKKIGNFIGSAKKDETILKEVNQFLIEFKIEIPEEQESIWIYQDGMSGSYYVKCDIASKNLNGKVDFNARLNPESDSSYRANRELLLDHNTFKKMKGDALEGREFNDIIVEYNKDYNPSARGCHNKMFCGLGSPLSIQNIQNSPLTIHRVYSYSTPTQRLLKGYSKATFYHDIRNIPCSGSCPSKKVR